MPPLAFPPPAIQSATKRYDAFGECLTCELDARPSGTRLGHYPDQGLPRHISGLRHVQEEDQGLAVTEKPLGRGNGQWLRAGKLGVLLELAR